MIRSTSWYKLTHCLESPVDRHYSTGCAEGVGWGVHYRATPRAASFRSPTPRGTLPATLSGLGPRWTRSSARRGERSQRGTDSWRRLRARPRLGGRVSPHPARPAPVTAGPIMGRMSRSVISALRGRDIAPATAVAMSSVCNSRSGRYSRLSRAWSGLLLGTGGPSQSIVAEIALRRPFHQVPELPHIRRDHPTRAELNRRHDPCRPLNEGA
jgi:hypothetical protein